MTGKVLRIVADKGFGFIKSDSSGIEYFFHRTTFLGNWDALAKKVNSSGNVKVDFNDVANNKGPRAENVKEI